MADFKVISFGGGVQSTALALMAVEGFFEEVPDFGIFADTGWEPKRVYENVNRVREYCFDRGLPIVTCKAELDLKQYAWKQKKWGGKKFIPMPVFTEDRGMLRRQCTREFKIEPIIQKIREICGVSKGRWMQFDVEIWIGISYDEIQRARNDLGISWQTPRYPLIEKEITREGCKTWLQENGFEVPMKSSCIVCPYHGDKYWRMLKNESPEEFQEAVEFDKFIRNKHDRKLYLHSSEKPLDEAIEDGDEEDKESLECGGYCFV